VRQGVSGVGRGVVAVGMALALMEGSEPGVQWLPPEGVAVDGICAPDAQVDLLARDCDRLPMLPKRAEYDPNAPEVTRHLATLTMGGSRLNFGNSLLPGNYNEAFGLACARDGYVAYALQKSGIPVDVEGLNGLDGASRMPRNYVGPYVVRVVFTETGQQSLDTVPTYGAVRAILVHELTHDRFADWVQQDKNKALLAELDAIYVEEFTYNTEHIRQTKGAEIVANLQAYRAAIDASKYPGTAAAVDKVIARFGTPGGLKDMAIVKRGAFSGKASFETFGDGYYTIDTSVFSKESGVDTSGYNKAEKLYNDAVMAQYADIHETNVLRGLVIDQGHAGEEVDETTATLITDAHINPKGLVRTIQAMESPRGRRYIRQLQLLRTLYKQNDPEALQYLNLDWVLGQFAS